MVGYFAFVNPRFIFAQINFTITRAGLAGQILASTLQHEKPELEVRNMELMKTGESYKVQLADLEELLLQELAAAEGNILQNQSLVIEAPFDHLMTQFSFRLLKSLNETKLKSSIISESLKEASQLQVGGYHDEANT